MNDHSHPHHAHEHPHEHPHEHRHELAEIRDRLAGTSGPQFWRSLEELADTEVFQEFLGREYSSQAEEWSDPVGRRQFLRLMGASLALAGVSGCAFQPSQTIVPYVRTPEQVVNGKPLFFASALTHEGYATGVLVESWQGRPTKIEGNPEHPASLGATDAFMQASILSLYDPDRLQVLTRNGRISTWDDFLTVVIATRRKNLDEKGQGLRILTETVTSPTLTAQMRALLAAYPKAKWYQYEPVGRDNAREGLKLAFGEDVEPVHHLAKADVIVSLDADFTTQGPGRLRDARQFASRREPDGPSGAMNRLYVIEPTPSCTGSLADHRLALSSHAIPLIAQAIAQGVGVKGVASPSSGLKPEHTKFVAAVVNDLQAHKGTSLVMAGVGQPASVHALAAAINHALGNVGKTIDFVASLEADPASRTAGLRELVADISGGRVGTLLIVGGNPVYDAPTDLDFASALDKVPTTIRLGQYEDETSTRCHWQIPEAHALEAWGDALAFDGTATIVQPLVAPLYGGKSAIELIAALTTGETKNGLDLVRSFWEAKRPGPGFDAFWRRTLRDGLVADSAVKPKAVSLTLSSATIAPVAPAPGLLEVIFRPDPTIWDGRFANNGWLQELPKPMSHLTWDNAALVSPATAKTLGVAVEEFTGKADQVDLTLNGRTIRMPIWVVPGQADGTLTLHLGYGRTKAGRVGDGAGFNVYRLRTSDAPWSAVGVKVEKAGERYELATTQHHSNMEGRDLVRVGTIDEYHKTPHFAQEPDEHVKPELTLFEIPLPQLRRQEGHEGNSWGMSINLNACNGCNACVIACQSENNIPVVGKEQVIRGREMHWLRIDRYYEGDADTPAIHHQPVPCMHCEKAPCELVCPVAATTHSAEGLNEMTYNRCVGTRYCGNNCPYKVRRFNFLQFSDETTPSLKLMRNPDVTVRSRGVMEKCSYCVQRINAARIVAEGENRRVGGNDVETACQSTCPTRAIVFGNLNDPAADVVKQKASPRNYALLAELNTRPRTTYLAKLTNPNPALKEG
jgi:MoCo/4Fe-4S cofactor protein with predicted Tat translocation signal